MNVTDKVFLVTGGGSGLGAAVATMLTQAGGKAVLVDINAEAGEAMAKQLGQNAVFCRADVTSDADGRAVIAKAIETFGQVDGLVNCAGVAPAERILGRESAHDLDNFARAVSINLVGTFNMLRLAAEAITKNEPGPSGERGVIINTASIAAYDGQIGQAAYAASKGGVASLTLPAARELARHGIRVVTIAPGIFKTPMMAAFSQDIQDALGAAVPFPSRLGEPSEYADMVRSIIENQMLNGEVIRLDGALRMSAK